MGPPSSRRPTSATVYIRQVLSHSTLLAAALPSSIPFARTLCARFSTYPPNTSPARCLPAGCLAAGCLVLGFPIILVFHAHRHRLCRSRCGAFAHSIEPPTNESQTCRARISLLSHTPHSHSLCGLSMKGRAVVYPSGMPRYRLPRRTVRCAESEKQS